MLRPLLASLILTLSACGPGGGEDFAIDVKRAPSVVFASLSDVRLSNAAVAVFSGMKMQVDKSGKNEIVYTIPMSSYPGSNDNPAIIRFKLEPVGDGAMTVVHVSADVPQIRMLMGEANMALSEAKVEGELKSALDTWAKQMASGSGSQASTTQLSNLFVAMSVAGNHEFQAQVNNAKQGFAAPGGLSDGSEDSTAAHPTIDPDQERPIDDAADTDEPLTSDTFETDAEVESASFDHEA